MVKILLISAQQSLFVTIVRKCFLTLKNLVNTEKLTGFARSVGVLVIAISYSKDT